MANHDDVRLVYPREASERLLTQTFEGWLSGENGIMELQGVLGYFAGRWGENAQTRCIAAALAEWNRPKA